MAISKDTVHQLLAYLEDCFLVRMIWMELASERQCMVNPRKAYPVDPGLIPVFDRSGEATAGMRWKPPCSSNWNAAAVM